MNTSQALLDILFVLLGPNPYRPIVIERGWTTEEWARLIERSIRREILRTDDATSGS